MRKEYNEIINDIKLKKTSLIGKIKSDYIIAHICNYINLNQKLKIIQENKKMQQRLKIGFYYYIFYKIYYKLEKGEKLKIDFNDTENDENIMALINRTYSFRL